MEIRKAALVLSDISGYTKFLQLHSMSLLHAEKIVSELMEAVIDSSSYPLELNKLQGDALLFYAFLEPDSDPDHLQKLTRDVLNQARVFFEAFHKTAESLIGCNICPCEACRQAEDLKLKSFLHLGDVAVKEIRGFKELAGESVILVHRLAKNSIPSKEYLLLTDDFYRAAYGKSDTSDMEFEARTESCEGIGNIPIKVFYPNPPKTDPRRRLLPTLYNNFRLDAYGALRTIGLAPQPLPAAKAVADKACEIEPGEPKKSVNLATFILDAFQGLGMLLTRQKNRRKPVNRLTD
ncbi:MAG: DUF2652 domain-containing protein [Verrucomicrobiota bacterium]